jgi:type III secretion protein V
VYLLDPAIEHRILDIGERPLTPPEGEELRNAIRKEIENSPSVSASPLLLTSFEVRRALRSILGDFPRLAVLCYQDLSPETNIQPIARISLGNSH